MMNKKKAKQGHTYSQNSTINFSEKEKQMAQSRIFASEEKGQELKFPKFESMIQDKTKMMDNVSDISNITVKQGDLSGMSNLTTDYGSKFNQDIIKNQQEKIVNMRYSNPFKLFHFKIPNRTQGVRGEQNALRTATVIKGAASRSS